MQRCTSAVHAVERRGITEGRKSRREARKGASHALLGRDAAAGHRRARACPFWLLPSPLQGRHRLLFLLFRQSSRVTVRPPSKRQSFQASALLPVRLRHARRRCYMSLLPLQPAPQSAQAAKRCPGTYQPRHSRGSLGGDCPGRHERVLQPCKRLADPCPTRPVSPPPLRRFEPLHKSTAWATLQLACLSGPRTTRSEERQRAGRQAGPRLAGLHTRRLDCCVRLPAKQGRRP